MDENRHLVDLDNDLWKDQLFKVPDFITKEQEDLAILYYEIVERLQADLGTIPAFSTLERLMAERIAAFFVFMRYLENPTSDEKMDARKSKELMSTWDRMFRDLTNHMMQSLTTEEIRSSVTAQLVSKTIEIIDRFIPDPAEASRIKEALADSLETARL